MTVSDEWPTSGMVEVRAVNRVDGQRLTATEIVTRELLDDETARELVKRRLARAITNAITERLDITYHVRVPVYLDALLPGGEDE